MCYGTPCNDGEDENEHLEIVSAVEDFDSVLQEDENSRNYFSNLNSGCSGMYEKNAVAYFVGYVGSYIVRKNNCDNCRAVFLKVPIEDINNDTSRI